MSTFSPSKEGFYPVPNLKLEQVHIYSRHGERSPVRVRMPETFPARWNLCMIGRSFDAAVLDETGRPGLLRVNRVVDVPRGSKSPPGGEGECLLGELTDQGRKTTLALGASLRKLYVDELGFIPSKPDHKTLFFRSTNMERTIESLQQVIAGLYPASVRGNWIPHVRIRNMTEESLLPNTFSCARLKHLDRRFTKMAAEQWNPSLAPLDKKLSKFIGGKEIRVDGTPAASGIMDTVRAAESNGYPVPTEFDPETRKVLENAICHEWFGAYYQSNEFRTLAMGPLLSGLSRDMAEWVTATTKGEGAVEERAKTTLKKFSVLSCHDTTLAGMLASLDCFDHKWPDFTAHVAVELFSSSSHPSTSLPTLPTSSSSPPSPAAVSSKPSFLSSLFSSSSSSPTPPSSTTPSSPSSDQAAPQHFVRLRYQSQPVTLPACEAQGDHLEGHPEVCTLEAFARVVETITTRDWEGDCARSGRE